jgi:hypothetical protein
MQPGKARTIDLGVVAWRTCVCAYLSVVVSVRGSKVPAESDVSGVFAEERIRGAEGVAGRAQHWVCPARGDTVLGAEAVQTEPAGATAGQTKVC